MIEHELRERIDSLLDDDTQQDWSDVSARAAATDRRSAPDRGTSRGGPRWRRAVPPGTRSLVAAAVVGAAIAAVPALAFSTQMREFVGLNSLPRPVLAARLTRAPVYGSRLQPGTLITVNFTVGKPGELPGTGVARGSAFAVFLIPKAVPEAPTPRTLLTQAQGTNGRYRATFRWPGGRVGGIRIAAWLNLPNGPPTAYSGAWLQIPIVNNA